MVAWRREGLRTKEGSIVCRRKYVRDSAAGENLILASTRLT